MPDAPVTSINALIETLSYQIAVVNFRLSAGTHYLNMQHPQKRVSYYRSEATGYLRKQTLSLSVKQQQPGGFPPGCTPLKKGAVTFS
jgi:hypothetical protein